MNWVDIIIRLIVWPPFWQLIVLGLIIPLIVVIGILWFERKTAARVQRRFGPLHVSPKIGGAIQLIADLMRYAFQEVIIPKTVDKGIYLMAPLTALVLSILPLVAVPFTNVKHWWPIPMDYSVLIALALSTISAIFIVLASWASNNKFSIIGGMRESYMITAYEIAIIISILATSAMTLSYNFVDIVNAQSSWKWFIVLNPLAFLAVFIAVLMATSGFPFEIPESENELVAGPYTEYSGLLYGINMGAAYIKRFVYSVLITLAFLGGWQPYHPGIGFWSGYFYPSIIVVVKATILMAIFSFLRAVYGRYRLDQALDFAWKILFPLALFGLGLGILEAYLGLV